MSSKPNVTKKRGWSWSEAPTKSMAMEWLFKPLIAVVTPQAGDLYTLCVHSLTQAEIERIAKCLRPNGEGQ